MSNFTIVHKPNISALGTQEIIPAQVMSSYLRPDRGWKKTKLDDHWFYTLGWAGWKKLINHLLPKLPKYYVDKFDCENAADWFKVMAAAEFGINSLARVDGWADMQATPPRGPERHAWCYFLDSVSNLWFQLEPQTGVIMDFDDPLYRPDEIIIG